MNVDNRSTGPLGLVLTHPIGGSGRVISLRVTDQLSGVTLVEVGLTPDQFADLMGARSVEVDAKVPHESIRHRLFRRRETETVRVPTELGSRYAYKDDPKVQADVDAWVDEYRVENDWDTGSLNLGSQGFSATFRRWV